jgi:hypothetical protein
VNPGKLATEDIKPPINPAWPRSSEQTGDSVNASAIRLSPSVRGDDDKHGFIPILVNIAKEKGVSTYKHTFAFENFYCHRNNFKM